MKQRSTYIIVILTILFEIRIIAQDQQQTIDDKWNAEISSFVDSAKGAWDGVVGFAKGMGQAVGYVSPDYQYSFRAWNDSADPVYVALQDAVPVLGAGFYGTVEQNNFMQLLPFQHTGDHFYHKQLYFIVWLLSGKSKGEESYYTKSVESGAIAGGVVGAVLGGGVFSAITGPVGAAIGSLIGGVVTYEKLKEVSIIERVIYPWPANDPYTYHYRAYSNHGTVKAEYLDIKGTTSEFLGTFYNHTDVQGITLTFIKDGASYTVSLEPETFCLLQSSGVANSIRPAPNATDARGFLFKNGTTDIAFLPIAPEGIANVACDEKTKQCVAIAPMNYTYEVFHSGNAFGIGMQGLAIGNFDQPTNGKIRDINPVECHFWYQSAEQALKLDAAQRKDKKQTYDSISFDVQETLWLYYRTKDYTFLKKVDPGTVQNFYLVRPQLAEGQALLYGVLLNTADEKKAQKFLDRLADGKIAQHALPPTVISQNLEAGDATVSPNPNGFIDDTQTGGSGLSGYLVLTDRFTPRGVGFDTFYYYLEPAQLQIDQFAGNILFDNKYYAKDASGAIAPTDEIMQELAKNITQWIRDYSKNRTSVEQAVKKYLTDKGNPALFEKTSTGQDFSSLGKLFYQMLLTGPISIANPPFIRKAGINYYTFALGAKPDNWPA